VVTDRVCAGDPAGPALGACRAVPSSPGLRFPPGVAAVIAAERCHVDGDWVSFGWRSGAGRNIRRAGEDVELGSVVVEAGSVIGARHLAILAATGCRSISVRRRVRVGVVSCGNELVEAATLFRQERSTTPTGRC